MWPVTIMLVTVSHVKSCKSQSGVACVLRQSRRVTPWRSQWPNKSHVESVTVEVTLSHVQSDKSPVQSRLVCSESLELHRFYLLKSLLYLLCQR